MVTGTAQGQGLRVATAAAAAAALHPRSTAKTTEAAEAAFITAESGEEGPDGGEESGRPSCCVLWWNLLVLFGIFWVAGVFVLNRYAGNWAGVYGCALMKVEGPPLSSPMDGESHF